ncbi:MAG TPA: AAA family ATPase [Desulfobacterales bacterium]
MDYFSIVNLDKEPFSNSPDPDFFYGSGQHMDCLQKLELALRLRRGLNVIIGEVGTGKTTLCRQLIRRFDDTDEFETHLILDPHFAGPTEFLQGVAGMLTGKKPPAQADDWQLKETIKNYLFKRGVNENRTVILIIDEGQKLPTYCLELLREFLNYETNEYKLLQIVIFAQKEFAEIIKAHANVGDRINMYHLLKPMSFRDTRAMIRYRLEKSSSGPDTFTFFTWPALVMIYMSTGGYPRKIINLCHRCILTMIIQNRTLVDLFLVRTCIQRGYNQKPPRKKRAAVAAATAILVLVGAGVVLLPPYLQRQPHIPSWKPTLEKATLSPPGVYHKIEPAPEPRPAPAEPAAAPAEDAPAPVAAGASAEKTQSAPAPVSKPAEPRFTNYDAILGRLTVQRNETFSGLIEQVYGTFDSRYFRLLVLANPQIENPDRIAVGQTMVLPAIPARRQPTGSDAWWVVFGKSDSLEEAFTALRDRRQDAPPMRMVPYWTPEQGLHFALVFPRHFTNEDAAEAYVDSLPAGIAAETRVQRLPPEKTVYFADPLFGRSIG